MPEPAPAKLALVVEDEPLFRLEAMGLLEDAGYVVLEASEAADAIRHLEGGIPVSVIVTDVRMPGVLDGLGLAREVAVRWPAVGIVVMSAERRPKADELPEKAVFVPKPYTPRIILAAVRKVVSH